MSTLNTVLQEALQRRFPAVAISPSARFLPMLDLSKGELSSTAAIEVARALRGDAPQIAQELVSDISQKISGEWRVVAGYIVLSNTPQEILREESPLREDLFPLERGAEVSRGIVCLVPDATAPVYARLRLIACSSLQALLTVDLEGRCSLAFEPEASRIVSSQDEILELVSRAVERCFLHESESRLVKEAPSGLMSATEPLIVWTSHHYHDRLSREVKQAFVAARNSGAGFLRIPPDGWLLSRERGLSELLSAGMLSKVIERLSSKEAWLRWVFHFASPIPSGDLDPSVALYDECASPRWSLQVLAHRVSQLLLPTMQDTQRELVSKVVSAPLGERAMMLRALFLPALTARAIREGEVLSWSVVVEEFAARAHALLNAPHHRAALKNGASSGEFVQINASLVLGIVGILPAVTEG